MKAASSHYLTKIGEATLADAQAYAAADEQYLFCVDFLEISAHDSRADQLVEILEDYFEDMIEEAA